MHYVLGGQCPYRPQLRSVLFLAEDGRVRAVLLDQAADQALRDPEFLGYVLLGPEIGQVRVDDLELFVDGQFSQASLLRERIRSVLLPPLLLQLPLSESTWIHRLGRVLEAPF